MSGGQKACRHGFGLAAALFVWLSVWGATAQTTAGHAKHASTQSAEAGLYLVRLVEESVERLTVELSPAQRRQELHRLLKEHFDLPSLVRFALGRYWRAASERERADFLVLLEEMIVRTSEAGLANYAGEALSVTETRASADEFTVRSALTLREGRILQIDWRLEHGALRLKIQDIVVEGISVRAVLRDYFAALIQERGGTPAALLLAMVEIVSLPTREWK